MISRNSSSVRRGGRRKKNAACEDIGGITFHPIIVIIFSTLDANLRSTFCSTLDVANLRSTLDANLRSYSDTPHAKAFLELEKKIAPIADYMSPEQMFLLTQCIRVFGYCKSIIDEEIEGNEDLRAEVMSRALTRGAVNHMGAIVGCQSLSGGVMSSLRVALFYAERRGSPWQPGTTTGV